MPDSIRKHNVLEGARIVLGVCGGIAAYKSVSLLRLLTGAGARVRVIMTASARKFVGPATFEALSGSPVFTDLFDDPVPDAAIRHISWAEEADAVVVAPATANILGKLANGVADDALSTFLLAVTCPVVLCPSMNPHMYESAPVRRNLDTLLRDGHTVLLPGEGEMACGTSGTGRLPEPDQILDRLRCRLTVKDLFGRRMLVTAGPTQEPIDPVRFISNPSTGKMGYAVARAAEYRGADVMLVSGPTHLPPPLNVSLMSVRTAQEMADTVLSHLDHADILIKTAAVSDYRPSVVAVHKIKKNEEEMTLSLVKNPDILKTVGQRKENRILVGFAAETRNLQDNALQKLTAKNLDMIVGNLIGQAGSGFTTDTNRVHLYFRDGRRESLEPMSKDAVAHEILDRVLGLMSS